MLDIFHGVLLRARRTPTRKLSEERCTEHDGRKEFRSESVVVRVHQHEHFQKRGAANRCSIFFMASFSEHVVHQQENFQKRGAPSTTDERNLKARASLFAYTNMKTFRSEVQQTDARYVSWRPCRSPRMGFSERTGCLGGAEHPRGARELWEACMVVSIMIG
jgi:hypothetical protein